MAAFMAPISFGSSSGSDRAPLSAASSDAAGFSNSTTVSHPHIPPWLLNLSACPCEREAFGLKHPAKYTSVGQHYHTMDTCKTNGVSQKIWRRMQSSFPRPDDMTPSSLVASVVRSRPTPQNIGIIIAGDSTAQQQLRSLRCLLSSNFAFSEGCNKQECSAKRQNLGICPTLHTVQSPGGASQTKIRLDYTFGRFLFYHGMLDKVHKDIISSDMLTQDHVFVVLCVGAWYQPNGKPHSYYSDLAKLGKWWKKEKQVLCEIRRKAKGGNSGGDSQACTEGDKSIHMLIREPLPQHFSGSPSGVFVRPHAEDRRMIDAKPRSVRGHRQSCSNAATADDFRILAMNRWSPVLEAAGISVLQVHDAMRDAADAHPGGYIGYKNDCTHYCAAAQYWWNAVLLTTIAELLSA